MTTLICTVSKKTVQTPLGIIIRALLKEKRLNQADLAAALDITDSNLSQRLRIGTMTQDLLKQTGEFFEVNLMDLIDRYEKGEKVEDLLAEKKRDTVGVGLFLSDEEVKEVIKNQTKSHKQLMAEFHSLVGQMRTWLEHDRQKSLRQEELINLLMEERAEYKAKKK
jgi:transcriptional regulator with XRE-family HTH domain